MPSQLLFFLLSWLMLASTSAFDRPETLPDCQPKCGDVNIPYPFGVGRSCSIAPWAAINCNTTFTPPKPFIGGVEIAEISLNEVRIIIKNSIGTTCFGPYGRQTRQTPSYINLTETPFTFSSTKNKVTGIGCDTFVLASFDDDAYASGCTSQCHKKEDVSQGVCSGSGCCHSTIPKGSKNYYALGEAPYNNTRARSINNCSTTFLVEEDKYTFKVADLTNISSLGDIPVVVNFGIGNQTCEEAEQNGTTLACKDNSNCYDSTEGTGYLCDCIEGYEGNPYLDQSCQGIAC